MTLQPPNDWPSPLHVDSIFPADPDFWQEMYAYYEDREIARLAQQYIPVVDYQRDFLSLIPQ